MDERMAIEHKLERLLTVLDQKGVPASTQNQAFNATAFNAITFLYKSPGSPGQPTVWVVFESKLWVAQTPRFVRHDAPEPAYHHPSPSIEACPNDAHQETCESDNPEPSTISASTHPPSLKLRRTGASATTAGRYHPSVAETRSCTRRNPRLLFAIPPLGRFGQWVNRLFGNRYYVNPLMTVHSPV